MPNEKTWVIDNIFWKPTLLEPLDNRIGALISGWLGDTTKRNIMHGVQSQIPRKCNQNTTICTFTQFLVIQPKEICTCTQCLGRCNQRDMLHGVSSRIVPNIVKTVWMLSTKKWQPILNCVEQMRTCSYSWKNVEKLQGPHQR